MNGARIKYTARFRNLPAVETDDAPEDDNPCPPTSRLARLLALAHHIDTLIDEGALKSHAETAKRLGVSRSRMAQVMKLLTMSPKIQEAILCGQIETSERALRPVLETVAWPEQGVLLMR